MKLILCFGICLICFNGVYGQETYRIDTRDIQHFWEAYDLLAEAETKQDSISIIQEHYLNRATVGFKEFLRIRNFTAEEYIRVLSLYPKFWASVRPLTEAIEGRKEEMVQVFQHFEQQIPNFKKPRICFAIGCLRTGGTISKDLILIGSEIAAADSTIDKSEMTGWLASIIGKTGNITAMIAHETIHVLQYNKRKFDLTIGVLTEGIADFLAMELLEYNINQTLHTYGDANECALWKAFEKDLVEHPNGHRRWLYQGQRSVDKPADLGYYLGYKIAQAYYQKQKNKRKAIDDLLNVKKYRQILKKSGYQGGNCH